MTKSKAAFQRIIIILLLLGAAINLMIFSRYFLKADEPKVNQSQTRTPVTVLYVDPADTSSTGIQPQAITIWSSQQGVQRVTSITQLNSALPTLLLGDSVAVSQAALIAIDSNALRSAYSRGVAVIALNIALSDLATKVNANSDIVLPNLDITYARGRIQVSMCQENRWFISDPAGPLPSNGLPGQPTRQPAPVPTVQESFGACFTDFASDQNQALSRVRSFIGGSERYVDGAIPTISPSETVVPTQ